MQQVIRGDLNQHQWQYAMILPHGNQVGKLRSVQLGTGHLNSRESKQYGIAA